MRARSWLLLILLLGACGQDPAEKPDAEPLQVSLETLQQQVHGILHGPHRATVVDSLVLETGGANPELPVRIWYPEDVLGKASLPVVLFSHGNWSDREKYDNLLRFWASHGYAVIAPTHLDGRSMARGIFNSLRFGQMGLIDARVQDMQYLLDHLGEIESYMIEHTGEALSLNQQSVVMAGHSFGAFTAQQFAGARAIDFEANSESTAGDDSVVAVLAISPPGPMFDIINEQSWKTMRGPVLVTTGTWDSNPQFWPDWRMHLLSHQTAVPGEQYALVLEGADHYLGNLICRPEREEAPQQDALTLLNAVSINFLNAYLKQDASALHFLQSQQLEQLTGNFARLKTR